MGRPNLNRLYNTQYLDHRTRSKRRGIPFEFTYEEWINWWGEDLTNRGRNQGQLVMARKGDAGAYHPDNVYKTTVEQNGRDALLGKPKTLEHIQKCVIGRSITHEQKKYIKETA